MDDWWFRSYFARPVTGHVLKASSTGFTTWSVVEPFYIVSEVMPLHLVFRIWRSAGLTTL